MRIFLRLVTGLILAGSALAAADDPGRSKVAPAQQVEFFEAQSARSSSSIVSGVMARRSGVGPAARHRGRALVKGNDAGPVVVPGRPEESPLIEAIRYDASVKMPPKARLPQPAIDDLTTWARMGVSLAGVHAHRGSRRLDGGPPGRNAALGVPAGPGPSVAGGPQRRVASQCGQPVHPGPARGQGAGTVGAADERTLDPSRHHRPLGLPPTPEEVEASRPTRRRRLRPAGRSPAGVAALRRAVGPPLARRRPVRRHQGLCRLQDADYPWASPTATTSSAPSTRPALRPVHHRATRRRPAASRARQGHPALTAMGFLTVGRRFLGNSNDDHRRPNRRRLPRACMGLTVTCARCHDHKFDPIPTADCCSLYGVLAERPEPAIPPEAAEPPRTTAYEKFITNSEAAAAEAERVRGGQASRAGRSVEAPDRRISPGRSAGRSTSRPPKTSCCSPTGTT